MIRQITVKPIDPEFCEALFCEAIEFMLSDDEKTGRAIINPDSEAFALRCRQSAVIPRRNFRGLCRTNCQ
jgi:hypothetical protein